MYMYMFMFMFIFVMFVYACLNVCSFACMHVFILRGCMFVPSVCMHFCARGQVDG